MTLFRLIFYEYRRVQESAFTINLRITKAAFSITPTFALLANCTVIQPVGFGVRNAENHELSFDGKSRTPRKAILIESPRRIASRLIGPSLSLLKINYAISIKSENARSNPRERLARELVRIRACVCLYMPVTSVQMRR